MTNTVYKFEVFVTDFNGISKEDIINELENAIDVGVVVGYADECEIEWDDESDLNMTETSLEAHRKLFE